MTYLKVSVFLIQPLALTLKSGLAANRVNVWRSNAQRQFEQIATVRPKAGRVTYVVEPGSVYTFTSTTGQRKGLVPRAKIAPASFPAPWRDDFERARFGRSPAYLSDLNGAFEIDRCADRAGFCLFQRTLVAPIPWTYWRTMREVEALTIGGDDRWRNYRVSADVRLDGQGYASLIGRMSKLASDGPLSAYQFRLDAAGNWSLLAATTEGIVATGSLDARAGAWHHLELVMRDNQIIGSIDGRQVLTIRDTRHARGLAGLGSGWHAASFDNFKVEPLDDGTPIVVADVVSPVAVPPKAPKLFVPEALDRAVHLTWSAVPGATGYRARIGIKDGVWDKTVEVGISTEQTFRTLTNGQTYWFQVVAVNSKGESAPAGQFATPTGR